MYSKQEAAQLKQAFWTSFGQYMRPVLSTEGMRINWINYRTGEKDVAFRMDADNRQATIAIELGHKDQGIRQLYWEQLLQLRSTLEAALGEAWTWTEHVKDPQGRSLSRVHTEKEDVGIFKKEDWPALISFFKPRIIALDEWWSQARYAFESLR